MTIPLMQSIKLFSWYFIIIMHAYRVLYCYYYY